VGELDTVAIATADPERDESARSGIWRDHVELTVFPADDHLDVEDAAQGLLDDDGSHRTLIAVPILVLEAGSPAGAPEGLAGARHPLRQGEVLRRRMGALGDDREERTAGAARDRRVAGDRARAIELPGRARQLAFLHCARILHDERLAENLLIARVCQPAEQAESGEQG